MLVYQNFINGRNHNDSKLIRKDDKNVSPELISWLSNCATDKPLKRIRIWDPAGIYYPTRLCLRNTATNINKDLGDVRNDSFCFPLVQVQATAATQKTIDMYNFIPHSVTPSYEALRTWECNMGLRTASSIILINKF